MDSPHTLNHEDLGLSKILAISVMFYPVTFMFFRACASTEMFGPFWANICATWTQPGVNDRRKEKRRLRKRKGVKQHWSNTQEDKNRKEGQKEGGKASSLVVADYFLVCDFYRSKCQNPAKLMPRDDQAPQWCSSVPKKQKEAQPTKTIQELCLLFCLQVKRSSGKKKHPTPNPFAAPPSI